MEQWDSLRTYLEPREKKLALVQSSYKINTDCLNMHLFTYVTIEIIRKITEVWNDSIWNEGIKSNDEMGINKWVSTAHTSILPLSKIL